MADLEPIRWTTRSTPVEWLTIRFIQTTLCEAVWSNKFWNTKIHGWFCSHFFYTNQLPPYQINFKTLIVGYIPLQEQVVAWAYQSHFFCRSFTFFEIIKAASHWHQTIKLYKHAQTCSQKRFLYIPTCFPTIGSISKHLQSLHKIIFIAAGPWSHLGGQLTQS